jgi:sodium/potassium-transporting ATPase subunit alpha
MYEEAPSKAPRIQWTDADVEVGGRRPSLHRSVSNGSLSIAQSGRGSIDPASALPIQYRTVSIQIDETKEKDVVEIKRAKDNVAKGV